MAFEYPITRDFPCRFFTHFTILFMFLMVGLVTLFNVAAVGYDLAPFYSEEFNPKQPYWWTRFDKATSFKKSPQCESRRLDTRDRFSSRLGMFEYNVDSLLERGNSVPAVSYNGTDLKECELSSMFVNVVTPERTATFGAHLSCLTGGARLNVSTSLIVSSNPEKDTIFSRYLSDRLFFSRVQTDRIVSPIILTLTGMTFDLDNSIYFLLPTSVSTIPYSRYWQIEFANCSATEQYLNMDITDCSNRPLYYLYTGARRTFISGLVNATRGRGEEWESTTTLNALNNLAYTFASAVMIDLGIASDYNIFKNDNIRQEVLQPGFNDTEAVPEALRVNWRLSETVLLESPFTQRFLANPSQFSIGLPLPSVRPGKIASSFLCRQWRRKPWSSFVGSIAAATASFVLAIWAGYMSIAMRIAKRGHPERNHCSCRHCEKPMDTTAMPLLYTQYSDSATPGSFGSNAHSRAGSDPYAQPRTEYDPYGHQRTGSDPYAFQRTDTGLLYAPEPNRYGHQRTESY